VDEIGLGHREGPWYARLRRAPESARTDSLPPSLGATFSSTGSSPRACSTADKSAEGLLGPRGARVRTRGDRRPDARRLGQRPGWATVRCMVRAGAVRAPAGGPVDREYRQRSFRRHAVLTADLEAPTRIAGTGISASGRPRIPVLRLTAGATAASVAALGRGRPKLAFLGRSRRGLRTSERSRQALVRAQPTLRPAAPGSV
jgi:hypothetical protein